jgi:membrane protein implicated in regulation of membrane protease activity
MTDVLLIALGVAAAVGGYVAYRRYGWKGIASVATALAVAVLALVARRGRKHVVQRPPPPPTNRVEPVHTEATAVVAEREAREREAIRAADDPDELAARLRSQR